MRTWLSAFALAAGCTGAASEAPPAPVEPTPPVHEVPIATAPAPAAAGVTWRSAWPAGEGHAAVDSDQAGRLLSASGTTTVEPGVACDGLHRVDAQGALWLPAGEPLTYPPAPVVSAALVERGAWRLADVLGPGPGIAPGVDAPDPALHRGIRVRSIRKVRRQGPPWQVVVGERRDQVVVALTDKDATHVMGGVVLDRRREGLLELASLPAEDLDGDGVPEIVVTGDGADGGLRAVLQADLETGSLTLRSLEERGPVRCAAP